MQQRTYHGGTATAAGLAEFLVQQFAATRRLRAQTMGEGGSILVQIGREGRAPAVTLGITHPPEKTEDLVVTLGEQEWIAPSSSIYSVAGSLAGRSIRHGPSSGCCGRSSIRSTHTTCRTRYGTWSTPI